MRTHPVFTISLDFELHWGGFEKWNLDRQQYNPRAIHDQQLAGHSGRAADYIQYFLTTRQVIPALLSMFQKFDVHATWATVGLLFHESKHQMLKNLPQLEPSYVAEELSAYHYIKSVGLGSDSHDDPFHFAPELIKKILATPHQELASHTFAHYYCNEPGQTIDQFRQDLKAAQRAASLYGVTLRSLVFPRNQFNDAYLRVCHEEGFTAVRTNPADWFWDIRDRDESFFKRLNRGLDAYFPIGTNNTYPLGSIRIRNGFPVCIPASRLLRPYRPQEFVLNRMKIERIKREMTRAARLGHAYHLWWHPHNFGNYPRQNLLGLEAILGHYAKCRNRYGMISLTMDEIYESLAVTHD